MLNHTSHQRKANLNYHFHLTLVITPVARKTNALWTRNEGSTHASLVGGKRGQLLWKSEWCFLTNLKLPCELAASLLGTYSKDSRPTYGRENCTSAFAVALFTITKLLNQPRCPTTAEWVKKTQHKFSAIKKEVRLLAGKSVE